MIHNNNFHINK